MVWLVPGREGLAHLDQPGSTAYCKHGSPGAQMVRSTDERSASVVNSKLQTPNKHAFLGAARPVACWHADTRPHAAYFMAAVSSVKTTDAKRINVWPLDSLGRSAG